MKNIKANNYTMLTIFEVAIGVEEPSVFSDYQLQDFNIWDWTNEKFDKRPSDDDIRKWAKEYICELLVEAQRLL